MNTLSDRLYETENFSRRELQCRCGTCQFPGMDRVFMLMMQRLREIYDAPMVVSSAYRCSAHNMRVSSSGSAGPHTTGKAMDIRVSGQAAFRLLTAACALRYRDLTTCRDHVFSGIGISQKGAHGSRFIHLDCLRIDEANGARPWVWSY